MINRFGVTMDWRGATVEGVSAISTQADQLGFGHLWVPEAWGLEAFSTIGHLVTVTSRIRIGTGIVNIFSRSAATIAMACATLNQASAGRFMLGLGTSGKGVVESFHGVKFERSLERLSEYVTVVRRIQTGQPADYSGNILKLARFRLYTSPALPPVPVYLGAMGEKSIALAGKIADGVIVTLYPFSKLHQCCSLLNSEEADQVKTKKIFAYIPLRVTENEEEEERARFDLAKYLAFYIDSMGDYYVRNLCKLGYEKQVKEVSEAVSRGGSNEGAKVIDQSMMDDLCLVGKPHTIIDHIARIPEEIYPVFAVNASSAKEAESSIRALREIALSL